MFTEQLHHPGVLREIVSPRRLGCNTLALQGLLGLARKDPVMEAVPTPRSFVVNRFSFIVNLLGWAGEPQGGMFRTQFSW